MAENKTSYEKTLVIAVKAESTRPLDWFTLGYLKAAIERDGGCYAINEHSCPKLAAGSVDAAFQRIDKLEERMCECLGHLVDALRCAKHGR